MASKKPLMPPFGRGFGGPICMVFKARSKHIALISRDKRESRLCRNCQQIGLLRALKDKESFFF
jgi:hypothetical protein